MGFEDLLYPLPRARAEQADALQIWGCELGEGFFLARPMEASAFERLLRSTSTLPAEARATGS